MSPQDGTVLCAINNRPFIYDTKRLSANVSKLEEWFEGDILKIAEVKDVTASFRLSELYIRKALTIARQHADDEPWNVVECLLSLGTLNFQQGRYDVAQRDFSEALMVAEQIRGEDDLDIAAICDFLAAAHQAQHRYADSEANYKRALEIRLRKLGRQHKQTAASFMNLAMIHNETNRTDDEAAMLAEAQGIMGDSAFVEARTARGARPISGYLPARTGNSSDLPALVASAAEIIRKHQRSETAEGKPPTPVQPVSRTPLGIGNIVGTWSIATDEMPAARTRTRTYQSDTPAGPETVTETKQEEGVSQYEGVSIYLCHAADASAIMSRISVYAQQNGLDWTKFGKDWPTIRRQAIAVKRMMDDLAASRRVDVAHTDQLGEYEFTNLPAGTYVLYASMSTIGRVSFWLSPPLKIERKGVLTFDFNDETTTASMWPRRREVRTASATRP